MRPVLLFVDPQSPYAYLANARAEAVLGVRPELRPIVLGPIFVRRGWGSWSHTSEREVGMREIERRAAGYGLPPIVWPTGWPFDSLAPARAVTWADRHGRGLAYLAALFSRTFEHGQDPTDLDVLRFCAERADLNPAELEAGLSAPSTKSRLRSMTDAAWNVGVRGVPTTQVGQELFFGDDQLELAAAHQASISSRPVLENAVTGERIVVVRAAAETDGQLLELETTWTRPGHRAPEHVHPEQEERFEVLSGAACVRVAGRDHVLHAGDTFAVPAGIAHLAWNPTDEQVRLRLQFRPALRWLEFVERLFGLAAEGRTDDSRALMTLMAEFPREIVPPSR